MSGGRERKKGKEWMLHEYLLVVLSRILVLVHVWDLTIYTIISVAPYAVKHSGPYKWCCTPPPMNTHYYRSNIALFDTHLIICGENDLMFYIIYFGTHCQKVHSRKSINSIRLIKYFRFNNIIYRNNLKFGSENLYKSTQKYTVEPSRQTGEHNTFDL